MTRDEFTRRLQRYERGRQWTLGIGVLPLLAVYLLVHTRWLKPYLQDHKHLVVVLMIVVPLAWLFGLARVWRQFGPRWLRLACTACGGTLADAPPAHGDAGGRCPHCGATLFQPDQPAS